MDPFILLPTPKKTAKFYHSFFKTTLRATLHSTLCVLAGKTVLASLVERMLPPQTDGRTTTPLLRMAQIEIAKIQPTRTHIYLLSSFSLPTLLPKCTGSFPTSLTLFSTNPKRRVGLATHGTHTTRKCIEPAQLDRFAFAGAPPEGMAKVERAEGGGVRYG